MISHRFARLLVLLTVVCAAALLEAKRNPADYPLRLHIYETHWNHNSFGYHAYGRANLFDEKGVPHGVEFTYECEDHLMASSGDEAYPAKWKKPGLSVEAIFGEIGQKPDQFHACEFKLSMKSFVFFRHNGILGTESPQEFMAKHPQQIPPSGAAASTDVPVSGNPHD